MGWGGDWWEREYLSESLTDYLFTYTLACVCAFVIVCVVCFSVCVCGSERMLTTVCCRFEVLDYFDSLLLFSKYLLTGPMFIFSTNQIVHCYRKMTECFKGVGPFYGLLQMWRT